MAVAAAAGAVVVVADDGSLFAGVAASQQDDDALLLLLVSSVGGWVESRRGEGEGEREKKEVEEERSAALSFNARDQKKITMIRVVIAGSSEATMIHRRVHDVPSDTSASDGRKNSDR